MMFRSMGFQPMLVSEKKTRIENPCYEERKTMQPGNSPTRRDVIKTTAALSAAAVMSSLGTNFAHAAGSDVLKVGLIGCGGRGTGAGRDCAKASPRTRIVAMGDLFKDRLDTSREKLAELGDQFKVTDDSAFVGFDAYQKVIDSDVDY